MTSTTNREPRTERGRRTRDGLIAAARTVFERQGFAATRMGDIAAEAGVSHGTVYTYFDTKEEVLAATMEQLIDQLVRSIRGADLTDPVARIANANERYLSAFSENAPLLRVVEEVAVTDERFSAILDDLRATHVRRVAAQIRRQQRDGTVHPDLDPQISAAALCAMVEGFSRHWAEPLSSPADPMGQTTLTLLWQRALGLPALTSTQTNQPALEETDEFTAEHEQFRKTVRSFIEAEINPYVDQWEEDRIFPAHELFPKLAEIGAFGLEYDEEYGGQGADHTYTLVFMEELGYSTNCAGIPMAISVQANMATPALHRFGSHELKLKYLKPAMEGKMVCSVAVSEPDAGSDVAAIRTKAVRDGDDWIINGRKMWITNGSQADWICTLVRTSDEGGFAGMSQIIVPTDTPGFSVGRTIEKMGNHSSDTAELVYDNVRVPVSNTIGEPGSGFQQQMIQFQDERLVGSYMATMGARRALERTIEYLRVREAFGKPLLANQYLQYNLAELIAEVDLLKVYNRAAAERFANGENVTREATIAKLKVGKLARQVADAVVQYHGGMGYAEENWPARYMRDVRLIAIGGGADEVMLRILSVLEGMGRK